MPEPQRTPTRLLAAIVHDVIDRDGFTTIADLADAVKARCARLRIPYDAATITAAIALVARTRPVLEPTPGRPETIAVDPSPISTADAKAILRRLGGRPRPIGTVRQLTPIEIGCRLRARDRQRALALIMQAIVDADAVCTALECRTDADQ